jgi:tetratricopeptide (TPR) repeat protein
MDAALLAQSGSGRIVAVVAEPGVGKSRLFFELKAAVGSDWKVLEAFAVSHGKRSPFLPIVELLQNYFGLTDVDSPQARRIKVAEQVTDRNPSLEAGLPYLYALLEIEDDKSRLGAMDPQLRRSRTVGAVVDIFKSEAEKQPLVLIVEDLHWLDDESQAILDVLVQSIGNQRFLLLINFRPEYQLPWSGKTNVHLIRLDPLDHENAEDLLPLKQLIIETTGGTPFFMEETLQSLFDEGALKRTNEGVELVRPLEALRIPPTVQTILAARIDRLHSEEKMLLQALAVLGREFFLSLAKIVAGHSEETLERLFDKLQLGEFVYEQPSISDVKYVFKHALTQEVAYSSILAERRKKLHEDVGCAIEELYQESIDDHLTELAHHYSHSTNQEKAVKYLLLAGVQAISRGALPQAVQSLESALALIRNFPESQSKDASELQVLSALATAYIAARGYAAPEVGPVLQRARELCGRVGNPEEQFAVLRGEFAWRIVRGELDLALELAKEAIALAEEQGDPGMLMEALFLMSVVLFYRSDFVEVKRHSEAALAHYDEDPSRTWKWATRTGEHAGVTHRCYLALALWHLGYADQARKVNHEMLELARSLKHPFSLAYALHHTCLLHYYLRLPTKLHAFASEQIRFCTEQGFPLFQATGTAYQGTAALIGGDARTALGGLISGLEAYRRTGAALAVPYYFGLLGAALTECNRPIEAKDALEKGFAIAEQNADQFHGAELHRLMGDLALSEGRDLDEVEIHYQRSFEVADNQQSKALKLRAALSSAKLCEMHGQRGPAVENLSAILSQFTEGLDTPDVQESQALLMKFEVR